MSSTAVLAVSSVGALALWSGWNVDQNVLDPPSLDSPPVLAGDQRVRVTEDGMRLTEQDTVETPLPDDEVARLLGIGGEFWSSSDDFSSIETTKRFWVWPVADTEIVPADGLVTLEFKWRIRPGQETLTDDEVPIGCFLAAPTEDGDQLLSQISSPFGVDSGNREGNLIASFPVSSFSGQGQMLFYLGTWADKASSNFVSQAVNLEQ